MDVGAVTIGGGVVVCVSGFIALIIVVAVRARRKERARQEALQRWAMQADFRYVLKPEVDWGRRMPGQNRRGVTLCLSGALAGRPVTIAEYQYSTTSTSGDGSSTTTTHYFVLTMARLRRPAPTVAVYRRGAMSKFGRALFGDRATAIGYEPFDSVYRVKAPDSRSVPAVVRGDLVREHLAGRLPDWSVHEHDVLTFREGRIGDPATIPAQLAPVMRVADLIDSPR